LNYELKGIRYQNQARAEFESIKNWEKDKEILISYARFNQTIGNYNLALELFGKIENADQDLKAQLGIACCYNKMGFYSKSLSIFKRLIEEYPNCQIANFYY